MFLAGGSGVPYNEDAARRPGTRSAARKAHVVPALLDLVRESGLLPAFCGGPSEPGDPGTPDTPVVPDEPVDPVEPGDPDDGGNGGALSGLKSFFERIASFFRRIVDFFRNLFNR